MGNYAVLGTQRWIYILDGITSRTLKVWSAHSSPVHSLCTFGDKLVSIAKEIRVWAVSEEEERITKVQLHPFEGPEGTPSLGQCVNTDLWCFVSGTLSVYDSMLCEQFKSPWMDQDRVKYFLVNGNQKLICSDRRCIGLNVKEVLLNKF